MIRVGQVGVGFGAAVHIPAFRMDPRALVVGLSAGSVERGREVAARLAVPRVYADWRDLVADEELDVVAIAVPPARQPGIALAAARVGKHLLLEKPVALESGPAEEVLAACRASGSRHAVDLLFSQVAEFQAAAALLRAGALGRPLRATVTWTTQTYANKRGLRSWKTDPAEGGGALANFGTHVVHYLEWLVGPIRRISARSEGSRGERVEMLLEHADGITASAAIDTDRPDETAHRVELHGSDGRLVVANHTGSVARGFTLETTIDRVIPRIPTSVEAGGGDERIPAVARIVRELLDAIEEGRDATPGLDTGCRVQRVIDAARSSAAASGQWRGISGALSSLRSYR